VDCKGCGKCCFLKDPYLDVEISLIDALRLPGDCYELRVGGPEKSYSTWMCRRENGACVLLDEGTMTCKHYSSRPDECRSFDKNHPLCCKLTGGVS
jgi:Fe-S-cluster containining protein